MIVVAGLTPAWQQILRFTKLELGEVNRAAEVLRCASGKVLNVCLALAALEAEARTICPVGGPAREPFADEFSSLSASVEWITTSGSTRLCTTLLDEATGTTTELVENAEPLTEEELRAYRTAYMIAAASARTAVFTGSLPTGVATSFYRDLAELTPGRIVADVRGPELTELLAGPTKPFLVKPNREELAKTIGGPLDSDDQLHAAMREINRCGAEWIVVTQGKDAVWASSRDAGLWRFSPPRAAKVVNPIGCGDCLCAGIAAGLDRHADVLNSIALGIAAANDNLRSLLPARLDAAGVAKLAASIKPERVD